jgi:glyoxylase-like metal-dependent hydrolase (beta-lactamase superfamily II)
MSRPLHVGCYRVRTINAGTFRLDGGAMFGSVPKTLWQKKAPADDRNRIRLVTRLLWIEEEDRKILVDLGNGDKFDRKMTDLLAIEPRPPEQWEVAAEELTDIVITHLHFDHAGGISRRAENGELTLTFPSATVHLQEENWHNARQPWERERASYLKENVDVLEEGDLHLVNGPGEIFPGIAVEVVHGHTRGMQWLLIRGRMDGTAGAIAYPADLIPTASHLHLPWIMGYDRCPETTFEEKEDFLRRAVEEQWVVVFEHDPQIAAATLKWNRRGRCMIDDLVEF